MCDRIDVVPAGKGTFKVLVNFIQRGVTYHTAKLANGEANKVFHQMKQDRIFDVGLNLV